MLQLFMENCMLDSNATKNNIQIIHNAINLKPSQAIAINGLHIRGEYYRTFLIESMLPFEAKYTVNKKHKQLQ